MMVGVLDNGQLRVGPPPCCGMAPPPNPMGGVPLWRLKHAAVKAHKGKVSASGALARSLITGSRAGNVKAWSAEALKQEALAAAVHFPPPQPQQLQAAAPPLGGLSSSLRQAQDSSRGALRSPGNSTLATRIPDPSADPSVFGPKQYLFFTQPSDLPSPRLSPPPQPVVAAPPSPQRPSRPSPGPASYPSVMPAGNGTIDAPPSIAILPSVSSGTDPLPPPPVIGRSMAGAPPPPIVVPPVPSPSPSRKGLTLGTPNPNVASPFGTPFNLPPPTPADGEHLSGSHAQLQPPGADGGRRVRVDVGAGHRSVCISFGAA